MIEKNQNDAFQFIDQVNSYDNISKVLMNHFRFIEALISSTPFQISELTIHLKEISKIMKDTPCKFDAEYCFKIFLNLLINVPSIEVIKKTLLSIKYFILSSHEASIQLINLQILPILILFLKQFDNNFVRLNIFKIFSNILKEDEKVFQVCIENQFPELYINEFHCLLNKLNLSDFYSLTLLDPVIDGLLSLSRFPNPFSQQLIYINSSILENRENLGMFVDDTLSYSQCLIVDPNFDNSVFFSSGFINHIINILCDDFSVYWTNSYLCLGQILKDQTPEVDNLIDNFDIVACCSKAISFADIDSFASGFYFFVSNFISRKIEFIPKLENLGLFNWEKVQFRIKSYKSTKAFVNLVVNVLYFSELEEVMRIVSNEATVNTLFDCLDNAKEHLICHSLMSFEQLETKYNAEIKQFNLFLGRLVIFLENAASHKNEEISEKSMMLIHALGI